ncbi:MAG: RNA polymerase sigma factor [Myxococcales bacterium]
MEPAPVHLVPSEDERFFLERLGAGDLGARGRLFDEEGPGVERLVARVLGPKREVEDLVHDIFVEVFRSAAGFEGDRRALSAWVRGVAVLTLRRHLRYARVRRLVALWTSPEDEEFVETDGPPLETQAAVHRLHRLVARLPADERLAFALRYLAGLELLEVAQSTGTSLATAKRRIGRARERLWVAARGDALLADWAGGWGDDD